MSKLEPSSAPWNFSRGHGPAAADTQGPMAMKQSPRRPQCPRLEIPGGGVGYGGLCEIIVTNGAVALAISVAAGAWRRRSARPRAAAQEAAEKVAGGRKVMVSLTSDKAQAGDGATGQGAGPPRSGAEIAGTGRSQHHRRRLGQGRGGQIHRRHESGAGFRR